MKTIREWALESWEKPFLSIVCWSFNHSAFLEEAFESFLNQSTAFPVEIVVHDDASYDDSPIIIKTYQLKYPKIFVPILQPINLFQRGLDINEPAFKKTSGKYISLCEGDDYWTIQDKLQRQVEFLEIHHEAVGTFHRGFSVDSEGRRQPFVWDNNIYKKEYQQKDCIFELLSGYPTASLVFRKDSLKFPFPQYFLDHPTDYMFDIILTESGSLGFLDFEGCAYRQHSGGVWSNLSLIEIQRESAQRFCALFKNKNLRGRYPQIKTCSLRKIDILWWTIFNEHSRSPGACLQALYGVVSSLIKKNFVSLLLWLLRRDCPFYYNFKKEIIKYFWKK